MPPPPPRFADPAAVAQACAYVRSRTDFAPKTAVILGSGLGALADAIDSPIRLAYGEIPHMPEPHVEGHKGELVLGLLGGVPVAILRGRVHGYEGYTLPQVTFGVRLLAALGNERLVVTNAAGALNPHYRPGDFMVLRDHINLTGQSPLRGPNHAAWGPRFVDMTHAYATSGHRAWLQAARIVDTPLHQGVYVGVAGPHYETPAEVRCFARLGGDAIGMSTVSEVLVARHQGLHVAGLSVITNAGAGMNLEALSHEEVTEVAAQARGQLCELLLHMVQLWR